MAATVQPVITITPETPYTVVAGTAINATDGNLITVPRGVISASPEELTIELVNSFAGTKVATIAAGDQEGAKALAITMADGTTPSTTLVTVNSAKHLRADGTILITFAASSTGTVRVYWSKRTS